MKKWLMFTIPAAAFIGFSVELCSAVELKITVPDTLTPYIEKIVNQTNEANAKDVTYVPIDIRQYCENILVSAATSWKVQQEKEKLEGLRDMLVSLPEDVQDGLIEQLKSAVGEVK